MCLDLHPSCKYIASAGMDNVILLWDINRQVAPNRLTGHKVPFKIKKESNS
jgi:WD40 repeat protein